MPVQASCDSCFHDFSVSSKNAGKRVRCPECGEPVRVPADDDAAPVRRSGSKSKGGKRKSQNNGLTIGLAAGGAGVLVVALLIFFVFMSGSRAPRNSAPAIASNPSAVTPETSIAATSASAQMPGQTAAPVQHSTTNAAITANGPNQIANSSGLPLAKSDSTNADKPLANTAAEDNKPAAPRVKMDMEELIKKVKPSVVRITTSGARGGGVGSGFVVDRKGTVVTNVHVLAGAKKAECEFSNGTKTPIVGIYSHDEKRDIAIVKIELPEDQLPPVPLATSLPADGASVVAFGAPIGLSFTVSEGIVSAQRPAAEMNEKFGGDYQGDWIQTSTPISPGNSGGPLLNLYGEVVAMNTMQLTIGQNLNFAVSAVDVADAVAKASSEFKPFTAEVIKQAPVSRSRSTASDETESERGRRLLSEVTEIFLLNGTTGRTLALDATGAIWDKVILKSKGAVEKSKIELSEGMPSDDAAIMFVILELQTSKKKTATAGTQELIITAELICKDPNAEKGESPVCRIWKGKENIGTISLTALRNGSFPNTTEENLSKFFRKFKSACIKARSDQKDGDTPSDKGSSKDKGK